ncbi:MAG: hypothetical protein HC810_08560 [Acaryochloridaceae cyanobacterium RL_2_7]|nr:hypothetical protein [Acaryochloridaceae cyanobacterium RL_2_7]
MAVERDELWSFVDHKGNKQWVWLALDRVSREIIELSFSKKIENYVR